MAKNRKTQAAEIRFGPVLKVVLLCSLICGSAIGYVWQKNQINHLGRKISEDEDQLKQFKKRNSTLTDQIALWRSPVMLDQRVKQLNLGLGPAQPMQVVRLTDVPLAPPPDTAGQFAQRPSVGGTP